MGTKKTNTHMEPTTVYLTTQPNLADAHNRLRGRILTAPVEAQSILYTFHTKCPTGHHCQDHNCLYLHPRQDSWWAGFTQRICRLCPLIQNGNTCPTKCGSQGGYCPFQHCLHENHPVDSSVNHRRYGNTSAYFVVDGTYCSKEECIGHCVACGLATEEERTIIRAERQREWTADR